MKVKEKEGKKKKGIEYFLYARKQDGILKKKQGFFSSADKYEDK